VKVAFIYLSVSEGCSHWVNTVIVDYTKYALYIQFTMKYRYNSVIPWIGF